MKSRLRVRLVPRAAEQIGNARKWWVENRPAAPDTFETDLGRTFDLIATFPAAGKLCSTDEFSDVRRVHIKTIRYYLYYRLAPDEDAVEVIAFWHSSRGEEPELRPA